MLLKYDLFELCSFSGDFRSSKFGGVKVYYLLLLHVCTVILFCHLYKCCGDGLLCINALNNSWTNGVCIVAFFIMSQQELVAYITEENKRRKRKRILLTKQYF